MDVVALGTGSSILGCLLYVLLNWSYTTAVFTKPGSTTNDDGYGLLPTQNSATPSATSFTVKSNGELRFCKKCQARKPDRAHHCSTCRRCVLKMDHHCPWLATCIGLRNHKAFLLFLVYTTFFCLYSFAVAGCWLWADVLDEDAPDLVNLEGLLPVNFVMLCVMGGILGLVVGAFTTWHIMLASRGQTTIECLEKTRYLSTVRKTHMRAHHPSNRVPQVAQQFVDFHTNALPGVTRPEEGEERRPSRDAMRPLPVQMSYEQREQEMSRRRYEEYLDEQDSEKLPNAFDLGWKRNLNHVLGPSPMLWFFPICNTTGDGWSWEASPKWVVERERLSNERDAQRAREINAGWGGAGDGDGGPPPVVHTENASRPHADSNHQISKADRVLGRDPNLYADGRQDVPLRRLNPRGRTVEDELDEIDGEEEDDAAHSRHANATLAKGQKSKKEAERRAMNVVTNSGGNWQRGGASGMLRTNSAGNFETRRGSTEASPQPQDEGVD